MSELAVNASTSYQPLKPIELESDNCPLCKKVTRIFAMVISLMLFGAAVGGCLGLADLGFALVPGLVIGACAGAILGLVLALMFKEIPLILKYRMQTLDQIKAVTSDTDVLDSIKKVKEIVSNEDISFAQTYDNHSLHHDITIITDQMKTRDDLKTIWKVFLEHLDGTPVLYPDEQEMKLDFSIEMNRLEGKKIEPVIEKLNMLDSKELENDLKQIADLQRECFGENYAASPQQMKTKIRETQGGCYVAREKGKNTILGFLWYVHDEKKECVISGIGRKAGATKLNMRIGEQLLAEFLSCATDDLIRLHVRASNKQAIELYKSAGFKKTQEIENFYEAPPEKGHRMYLYRKSDNYMAFMNKFMPKQERKIA